MAAAAHFGGRAILTQRNHPTGTDRIAEVARTIEADVIVNLQGDEPLIDPRSLDLLPTMLARDPSAQMATLATPIDWRASTSYRVSRCSWCLRQREQNFRSVRRSGSLALFFSLW